MNKIILYRFSKEGFAPIYQQYHARSIEYLSNLNKESLNQYPEHLHSHIIHSQQEILPNWHEYTNGVFAFADNFPDNKTIEHLLNHLTNEQKKSYQWWSAEISENEYCFQIYNNQLWKKNALKTIKEVIKNQETEIFIPSQFLNISNIQKVDNFTTKKKLKY